MPGDPGATVVTTLVCYQHTAHEAAGATGTRLSPRPRLGGKFTHSSGASRRENAELRLKLVWLFENCFCSISFGTNAQHYACTDQRNTLRHRALRRLNMAASFSSAALSPLPSTMRDHRRSAETPAPAPC